MTDNVVDFSRVKERRGALEELAALDQCQMMASAVEAIIMTEELDESERQAKLDKLAEYHRKFEDGRVKAEERLRNA